MLTRLRLFTKRLSRIPYVRYPIVRLWNTYEHIVFSYHCRRNLRGLDRDADIDPVRVFWISPDDVTVPSNVSFDFLADTARVVDGQWDRDSGLPVTESSRYRWFEQRFCDGRAWEETDKYVSIVDKIGSGRSKRYATVDEFEEKLRSYDRLYDEFEDGNYLLQSELVDERTIGAPGDGGRTLVPSLTEHTLVRHEIAVNVGRDGTLFRNDGRHRLALAHLAGLEEVPVRIVVRHAQWQALRDDVARTIDEAIDEGVSPEDVPDYVEDALNDELEDVFLGLEHPDLRVIFERRLAEE